MHPAPPAWLWPRFNPRTREGATTPSLRGLKGRAFQSTHPRGCDRVRWPMVLACLSFNPRTREGATAVDHPNMDRVAKFQSTHPRGCDAPRRSSTPSIASFNPRTREGATMHDRIIRICTVRFQSTHPRGCDPLFAASATPSPVSIHAPARVRLPSS